jgi:hypothetical protein
MEEERSDSLSECGLDSFTNSCCAMLEKLSLLHFFPPFAQAPNIE